jgi:hypothetical protein
MTQRVTHCVTAAGKVDSTAAEGLLLLLLLVLPKCSFWCRANKANCGTSAFK